MAILHVRVHTTKIQTEQSENRGNPTLGWLFCSVSFVHSPFDLVRGFYQLHFLSSSSGLCHWAHRTGLNIHSENYM